MRVLMTWLDDHGDLKAAIVKAPQDEEPDPSEVADVAWQKHLEGATEDAIYTVVTLPEGDFRPDVFDEYGSEAPMQFIDL